RGPAAAHAVAFDRGGAVAVATRLPLRLARSGGWRDTTVSLPVHQCTDLFTGRVYSGSELLLHDLLSTYPVALLAPTDSVEAAA
ncbi:malto-oligosyltrehalose synthase, partial [Micromonospora aurantiaca]|nr:malto-oligosyltrehalose synthase [Micromonospora aurantiaca]